MACPNGSEPKPSSPPTWVIRSSDVIEVAYGGRGPATVPYYGIVGAGLTDLFCSSPPEFEFQGSRFPGDIAAAAYNRTVVGKWNELCRCKRKPSDVSPDLQGGQCRVRYRVRVTLNGLDYRTFEPVSADREGTFFGPISTSAFMFGKSDSIEYLGWIIRHWDGENRSSFGIPCEPGSSKMVSRVNRVDGLPDVCGDPPPGGLDIPPSFYFAPDVILPDLNPPPCSCPPPGEAKDRVLFVPVPTFVPAPIPAPILIPVPIPIPFPVPIPAPVPPVPPQLPRPKPKDDDMDCCDEVLAQLAALRSDVTAIREEDFPDIRKHFDDRFDGVIECLDFARFKYDRSEVLGSGVVGTAIVGTRVIGVKAQSVSPEPQNRSKRQSGGGTPDVLQGGWLWYEFQGGMSERMPLDASTKFIELPLSLFGKPELKVVWRGANDISWQVSALIVQDRDQPPYSDRPCE